jgi:hypothetical protein
LTRVGPRLLVYPSQFWKRRSGFLIEIEPQPLGFPTELTGI